MKEYKIDLSMYKGKVRELVSEAVQKKAFELGYEWSGSGKEYTHTNCPYLFFNEGRYIKHLNAEDVRSFEGQCETKISAADFLALTQEEVKEPEFKPFDRVLVRDCDDEAWTAHLYSHLDENLSYIYQTVGDGGYHQCIPYEGNEHLLGTTEAYNG